MVYRLDTYNITLKRVPTNGIELNVAEAGQDPVVFLLHGFPEGWASWGPQIKFLVDQGYKVVAPEMRGYGERPMGTSRSAYRKILRREIQSQLGDAIPFAIKADRIIRLLIDESDCSIEKLAETLGVSPRTLQLRLKQE